MSLINRFRIFYATHKVTSIFGGIGVLAALYHLIFIAIPQRATGGITSFMYLVMFFGTISAFLWALEDANNYDPDTKEYKTRRIIMYIIAVVFFGYLAYRGLGVQSTTGIR